MSATVKNLLLFLFECNSNGELTYIQPRSDWLSNYC